MPVTRIWHLRHQHGFVQGLRQIEPGQLGGGQGDELAPRAPVTRARPVCAAFCWA